MKKILDDNTESAFPLHWQDNFRNGMTLRDYFAAQAMNGIISGDIKSEVPVSRIVHQAYFVADRMLAQRNIIQ